MRRESQGSGGEGGSGDGSTKCKKIFFFFKNTFTGETLRESTGSGVGGTVVVEVEVGIARQKRPDRYIGTQTNPAAARAHCTERRTN